MSNLVLLACPVGMGLIMWMMMRGDKKDETSDVPASAPASVELLREEHRRLGEQIESLETDSRAKTRVDADS